MKTIDKILSRVSDLPMLPTVASRLLAVTGDEKHSLKEIVKIIENDPAMTTKILKIAGSAAMFRGQEITSLSKAILNLGEKMIIGIVLGTCANNVYNKTLDGYISEEGEFWDHSLLSAISSREISQYSLKNISSELAFTAGLLHDIGKSIISEFLTRKTEKITKWLMAEKVEDFLQAEREVIGTDHAEVGYEIAKRWSLPVSICESIKNHHYPSNSSSEFRNLVYIVHLGDIIAMLSGAGTGADTLGYKIDLGYKDYLKIEDNDISSIIYNTREDFEQIKSNIFHGEDYIS